jgi:hypothetical protein
MNNSLHEAERPVLLTPYALLNHHAPEGGNEMATAKLLDFPPVTQLPTTEANGFEIACETEQSQPFRMRTGSAHIVISQLIRDKAVQLWESVAVACTDDGENLTVRVVVTLPDPLKSLEISLTSNPEIDAELPIVTHVRPHSFSGRL